MENNKTVCLQSASYIVKMLIENIESTLGIQEGVEINLCLMSALGEIEKILGHRDNFIDPTTTPDLFRLMSVRQRILNQLRNGDMSKAELADVCESTEETIRKTVYRHRDLFTVRQDGKITIRQTV